jgi:hypothetical protein
LREIDLPDSMSFLLLHRPSAQHAFGNDGQKEEIKMVFDDFAKD